MYSVIDSIDLFEPKYFLLFESSDPGVMFDEEFTPAISPHLLIHFWENFYPIF